MEMQRLTEQWHFDPLILLLVAGMIYFYYLITGFKGVKNTLSFSLAVVLFLLVEFSPLDNLGMRYFSAHMISHVITLLICGPLLVMSLRVHDLSPLYDKLFQCSSFLSRYSWLAWLSGVGIMWFWHVPAVFDGAMRSMHGSFSVIPVLQSGSMLMAGMLFSWPLFGPFKSLHLGSLSGVIYLFTACVSCSLLGLLITFAPLNTWHYYAAMQIPSANPWNISPIEDQQAAGLIMWVPCCFVYLGGCLFLLYRWFAETDLPVKKVTAPLTPSTIQHAER